MKKKLIDFKFFLRFFLSFIIVHPFLIGCSLTEDITSIKDSLDGLKIVIGTPSYNNTIFIDIKDQDGNFINDVKVKVSGTDAKNIYDNTLDQTNDLTYSTKDGRFYFILNPNISSSALAEKNVIFNITPIANGYIGFTQQVIISGEQLKLVTVKMLDISANIEGIVQNTSSAVKTTASGETVQQETVVNSEQATVKVEAQTILKNSKNEPIMGTVKSDVTYFNPTDPQAQALIALSLAGDMVLKDGSKATGRLVSAGMFNALMTSGKDTVKTLTGSGLSLKARVPSNLINPVTGNSVREGEIIPMWSKEEGTTTWKYEKDATVKKDNEGLYLMDAVNHLSDWSWNWQVNACKKGPTFNWVFNGFNSGEKQIVVSIDALYGGISNSFDEYVNAENSTSTTLLNTPSNKPGILKFSIKSQELGKKLTIEPSSIDFTDLCSLGTKTVTISSVDDLSIGYYVKMNLNISASDGNITLKPSLWLDYNNQMGHTPPDAPNELNLANNFISSGQIQFVNGQAKSTLALIPETNCIIKTKIAGKTVTGKIRINYSGVNKDQLEIVVSPLSADAKESIVLATIPKPSRGEIVNIEYQADLSSTDLNMLKAKGTTISSTK